jgi:hypothetical protein
MKAKLASPFALTPLVCAAALLAGCASAPPPSNPGSVKVQYTQAFPDGSYLKEIPTEVTIVRRANTQREVGKQVALNVLMLALGGGVGVQRFGKEDLKGEAIEAAGDRANLANNIPGAFAARLQEKITAAVQQDAVLASRSWRYPILVAGGRTRLLYEELQGADEERFRLLTHLVVYKARENRSAFSITSPYVTVDCSGGTEKPLDLPSWALDNHALIRTELVRLQDACESKVLAALPELLKE